MDRHNTLLHGPNIRLLILGMVAAAALPLRAADEISFDRDIAPVLEQRCLRCHNDEVKKGGLSLASRQSARSGGESGPALVANKPDESLVLEMVGGKEPAMPKQGEPLTREQVALLTRWVAAGADWPADRVLQERAPKNDQWWSLQSVKRPPLPEVKNKAWPRNAIDHFVLVRLEASDLKPSPEADPRTLLRRLSLDLWGLPPSPAEVAAFTDAPQYEQLVDSRLQSIHFGERYAQHWLDVVRFAETNGFEMNQERPNAWPYRDYVIRSFQNDLPYDRFVAEQLAGDKLDVDEATGYLVAGPWDQVKSPDPVLTANQRADELHDIVSTLGSSLLGLTTGCARCHDHKFDPIPQSDYYALKAIFEGVQHGERELRSAGEGNREEGLAELADRRLQLQAKLRNSEPLANTKPGIGEQPGRSAVTHRTNIDRFASVEARFVRFTILETSQAEPCIDELEVFTAEDTPRNIALASAGAKATASGTLPGFAIHRLDHIQDGKYGNDFSWISSEPGRGWVQLEFPEMARIDAIVWGRDQSASPRFEDRVATRYRIETSPDGQTWRLVASSDDRQPRGTITLAKESGELAELRSQLARLDEQIAAASRPPMVYGGKMTAPAATHRFHRGDPTQPREEVTPGALSALKVKLDLPDGAGEQQRRLALAGWITSRDNPLTARVIVNRLWQWHFGSGLVDTPGDFGLNGARPTHPELLDYLAAELMDHDWSLRHIHRLIVTSATYRQSSRAVPAALAKDAATRLLWRFPPRRMEAEVLRDCILAASGQLDLTTGGPGFSPFEPNANYVRVYTPKTKFAAADFRRMVYMTKVRMHVDPTFGAFDCPDGGQVAPKRSRSTTPLQALNLLNSAFVLDQAKTLAQRLKREAGDDAGKQITLGFQLAFQRKPSADELVACREIVDQQDLVVFCRALLNSNEFLFVD